MVNEIEDSIVGLFKTWQADTLANFRTIVGAEKEIITDLHPALQFEHNGVISLERYGNGYKLSIEFFVTVQSSCVTTRAAGRRAHSQLVTGYADGKLTGLVPATAKLSELALETNGISWNITVGPTTEPLEIRGKSHRHFTYVTGQTVTFTTILNKSAL